MYISIVQITDLIRLIAEVVIAVGVIYNAILSVRTHDQNKSLLDKVEEVHVATNSMKDALVEVTRDEALARGKLEGAAEQAKKEGQT